ncbi:hypothetical protein BH24ACT16_BH24ACT16_04940 [soil metagenome]
MTLSHGGNAAKTSNERQPASGWQRGFAAAVESQRTIIRRDLESQLGRILKLIKRLRSQERGIRLGGDMQKDAAKTVENEVGGWPGVTVEAHSRGAGRQFRYGKIELGHLHGDSVGDLPFPKKVHDELLAQGRASTHPPLPNSGWVRRRIESPEDVTELIQLFRLNYERAKAREERRAGRVEGGEG